MILQADSTSCGPYICRYIEKFAIGETNMINVDPHAVRISLQSWILEETVIHVLSV